MRSFPWGRSGLGRRRAPGSGPPRLITARRTWPRRTAPQCTEVCRPCARRGELGAELKDLGADVVTTAEGLRAALRDSGLRPPVLGLDGVGGVAATAVARALE